jgi:membrane fusion protein, copper/silver efflux system
MKCSNILLILVSVASLACSRAGPPAGVSHYTCPMHPQIQMESSGSCPICGMDLVAVPVQDHSDHAMSSKASQKSPGIRIAPAHTQNIGVQTEAAADRSLTRSILAYGKVAHDADLWVAQHEFIEAIKLSDRTLIRAAEHKLLFLGLSKEWIALLRQGRTADLGLHLPTHDAAGYLEAFLHPGDIEIVHVGQAVEVLDDKSRKLTTGSIAAIGTMVDSKTRLIRALVKADAPLKFKLNTFVQFRIQIPLGTHLSIPKSAILFNGDHNMVYIVTADGQFSPRTIQLGEAAGAHYVVQSGLAAGDVVVTNGHFLIDSETQIKTGGAGHDHQQ